MNENGISDSKLDLEKIEITDLEYEDIDECYEMNKKIFNESYDLVEIKNLYKKFSLKKDQYRFLVAKINGKVVGYTSVVIAYNLFDGNRPFITLWWVGVDEKYRKHKVGTKMFEKIEEIAKSINCELIYFTSEKGNTVAHKFYNKLGYDENIVKAFYKCF